MKNRKSSSFKRIIQYLVFILIVGCFANNFVDFTYAVRSQGNPNVIFTVGKNGQVSQEGSLFGNGLWYPGKEDSGIIRINNQFGRIEVNNLALKVNLLRVMPKYDQELVYESFLNNMRLTIERGKLLVFEDTLVDNQTFKDLLYKQADDRYDGFKLEDSDRFILNRGHLDLKYTLCMDEKAGKELQNIKSEVSFLINVAEKPGDGSGDDGSGDDGSGDDGSGDDGSGDDGSGDDGNEDDGSGDDRNEDDGSGDDGNEDDGSGDDGNEDDGSGDDGNEDGDGGNDDSEDNDNNDGSKPLKTSISIDKHWSHDCIKTLLDNGIIQGYPHKTMTIEGYRNSITEPEIYIKEAVLPDNNITRAEAAMLIGKALKLEEVEKLFSGYIDSVPGWARGYIISTSKKDIFEGYPGKRFKPNNNITREEMTAVLIRAFEKKFEKELELGFIDNDDIAKWAKDYVKSAVQNDVIEGYPDNTFKPDNPITRAEAFTIICKLLELHEAH